MDQFYITPDEQSQEFMSQVQRNQLLSIVSMNPDIRYQIENDNTLYEVLHADLLGYPKSDQEQQKLNDIGKIINEVHNKRTHQIHRRVEEKQKFCFKKTFKKIEQNFYKNYQIQRTPNQKIQKYPIEFYETYFNEVKNKMKTNLSRFIHPQRKFKVGKIIYKAGFKSFSQPYIKTIMQSQKFKEEAIFYIKNRFVEDAQKEMKTKIKKFIIFCQKIYWKSLREYEQNVVKKIEDDEYFRNYVRLKMEESILKNSKCKVPWSLKEIIEVQKFALAMINES